MIQAAMVPDTYKAGLAIEWMLQYFDTYGDQQPNGDLTKLSINTKREIYQEYCADLKLMDPEAVLSETQFSTYWRAMFPSVRIRSWVNIPGKCSTCMEIDKLRKQPCDKVTGKALKQAHLLHRGGLFMLERQRYALHLFSTEDYIIICFYYILFHYFLLFKMFTFV